MGRFFSWLWHGFGMNSNAAQALGITICIFLGVFWILWKLGVLTVKIIQKIRAKKAEKAEQETTAAE